VDERSDQGPVRPGHPGSRGLAAKHGKMVAQHEDLDVLGRIGAGEQHHPADKLVDHEVRQSECHQSDHADPRSGANLQVTVVGRVSGTHKLRSLRKLDLGQVRPRTRSQYVSGLVEEGVDMRLVPWLVEQEIESLGTELAYPTEDAGQIGTFAADTRGHRERRRARRALSRGSALPSSARRRMSDRIHAVR
jgi:hypothetical protein